jgi:hypothetical protein
LPPLGVTSLAGGAQIGIGETLFLGLFEGFGLHQHTLALVTAARPAEPYDDRPQAAMFGGAASQRGVATRQVDQVVEIGALHAKRLVALHGQQFAFP